MFQAIRQEEEAVIYSASNTKQSTALFQICNIEARSTRLEMAGHLLTVLLSEAACSNHRIAHQHGNCHRTDPPGDGCNPTSDFSAGVVVAVPDDPQLALVIFDLIDSDVCLLYTSDAADE